MPSCEVILEDADKTIFRIFAQVRAAYSIVCKMTLVISLGKKTKTQHDAQLVPVSGGAGGINY